jgi:hypothetical protein
LGKILQDQKAHKALLVHKAHKVHKEERDLKDHKEIQAMLQAHKVV